MLLLIYYILLVLENYMILLTKQRIFIYTSKYFYLFIYIYLTIKYFIKNYIFTII